MLKYGKKLLCVRHISCNLMNHKISNSLLNCRTYILNHSCQIVFYLPCGKGADLRGGHLAGHWKQNQKQNHVLHADCSALGPSACFIGSSLSLGVSALLSGESMSFYLIFCKPIMVLTRLLGKQS